ncbi:AraC family transcriptional regulator [Hydrogenophaga crocea]|uniref:AraC family transcriptional regulator n=1 Tax=Hydrogenophaga crocea TaxID=2716225 RepID=A0A6G8ICH2_9BURK|nr:AraC family transcriptional regulator [Hydrogenophaga crocea]QIM50755.1 AraC family transcriptional regulator [Hydrogenophaga crocea]
MSNFDATSALSDILRTLRLRGGVFVEAEFGEPWCVLSQVGPEDCGEFSPLPREVIAYHYVCEGAMSLRVEGDADAVELRAGDLAILPRNHRHRLGSDLTVTPLSVEEIEHQAAGGGLMRVMHPGQTRGARFFCGYLGHDNVNDPLIQALPHVLHLSVGDATSANWLESSMRFAAQPQSAPHGLTPSVLSRLAELLFAQAVQQYVELQPEGSTGWLAGLRDARVGRALALLHADHQRAWTTEELAHSVGASRSTFAERFTSLVGEPPMRYLARQRMRHAAQQLRESDEPIARIAQAAGYESEPAFHRAFKRSFKTSPAAWRREQTATHLFGRARPP